DYKVTGVQTCALPISLHIQGALLTALEADRDRHHLFSLFLRGLRERKRPAIVVFEDVHWADEATLDLIKFLGRRIDAVRALVIRSEERRVGREWGCSV